MSHEMLWIVCSRKITPKTQKQPVVNGLNGPQRQHHLDKFLNPILFHTKYYSESSHGHIFEAIEKVFLYTSWVKKKNISIHHYNIPWKNVWDVEQWLMCYLFLYTIFILLQHYIGVWRRNAVYPWNPSYVKYLSLSLYSPYDPARSLHSLILLFRISLPLNSSNWSVPRGSES